MNHRDSVRWAVVGLGRAGRSRVQAICDRADSVLVHRCSRRDHGGPTLDDVLASDIDAVALCRESERHAQDAASALKAGKHLLVEYPLALSLAEATQLVSLARAQSRVLHVGHFGLLSPFHAQVAAVLAREAPARLHFSFTAGCGQQIRVQSDRGQWGQAANARLQALWSWFGALTLESAMVHLGDRGYTLEVRMIADQDVEIVLTEARQEGNERGRSVRALDRAGALISMPDWGPWRGGFQADTRWFIERLAGNPVGPYVSPEAVVGVVGLGEEISATARVLRDHSEIDSV